MACREEVIFVAFSEMVRLGGVSRWSLLDCQYICIHSVSLMIDSSTNLQHVYEGCMFQAPVV